MRIIALIEELKKKYECNTIVRKNGTMLLGPGKIPKSDHMLYKGLTQDVLDEYLISQYKYKFPSEYVEFLKYTNGATLFSIKIRSGKLEYASSYLTILGLPLTPATSRAVDMEEPFDVRIEDLRRHKKIPKHWLKCGRYKMKREKGNEADLFIDTETNMVFSCRVDDYNIVESWASLDDCLCNIFEKYMVGYVTGETLS